MASSLSSTTVGLKLRCVDLTDTEDMETYDSPITVERADLRYSRRTLLASP